MSRKTSMTEIFAPQEVVSEEPGLQHWLKWLRLESILTLPKEPEETLRINHSTLLTLGSCHFHIWGQWHQMLSVPIKIPAQAFMPQCKKNEDIFVSFHLLTAGRDETEKTVPAYAAEGNQPTSPLSSWSLVLTGYCSPWLLRCHNPCPCIFTMTGHLAPCFSHTPL